MELQGNPLQKRLSGQSNPIWNRHYLHYRYLFRDLNFCVEKYARGRVLDVGCGNKPYEALFSNCQEYLGCDIEQSSENRVDVICLATELSFEGNSFDTVITTQVMEHVDDHRKALAEMWRVLKPGGCLIFSVPFAWELHGEPFDFFRFSKHGIQFLLDKYDFERVQLLSNGGKWAAIGQLRLNMLLTAFKGKPLLSFLNRVLIKYSGFIILTNVYYCLLDKFDYDDRLTLNYVVVARKKT